MTGLRERLRSETADQHAAVEQALDLPASLDGRARTIEILARFAGFFAILEPALDRALGPSVMAGRHRYPDLEHDLAMLGVGFAARVTLPHAPGPDDPPALTPAAALGALYVVEGARLGGQLIGRALTGRDWLPADGLRFWPAHRDLAQWRSLLALLDAATEPDAVVAGAASTFDQLLDWMVPTAHACARVAPTLRDRLGRGRVAQR